MVNNMTYHARYKQHGISYRVLCPNVAIGTIDETTYNKYASIRKTHANQYVKTLIVPSNEEFRAIRNEYKGGK